MKIHDDRQLYCRSLFPLRRGNHALRILGTAIVAMFLVGTIGCESEEPVEEAAEETGDALESAGDAVEDVAEDTEDALESAADTVEDSADEMEDEVEEEME